jgi:hypothetical protein
MPRNVPPRPVKRLLGSAGCERRIVSCLGRMRASGGGFGVLLPRRLLHFGSDAGITWDRVALDNGAETGLRVKRLIWWLADSAVSAEAARCRR